MATEAEIRVIARDEASRALSAIKKELDGVGKTAETSGGHVNKFSSQVAAMAAGMVTAQAGMKLVGAAVGFFGDSVKAASDLGESMNAVDKIFGDSASKVKEWGDTSANSFGLSQRAFNQLATPLGAMLKNSGEGMDVVADKTIELTKRAADMASVFNTDVDQALGAITAAMRGERDPIEKYGVSINEAAVQAKALEMGLIPVTENSLELKDAQLKLTEAQEKLNKLQAQGVEVLPPTQKQLLAVEAATKKYNDAVKKSGAGSLEARQALASLNAAREAAQPTTKGAAASESELARASLEVEKAQAKVEEAMQGTTGEIDLAAKQQATYALIMEQTASSAGDFADTSDQLANKTRIQKAEMEELQATIGQKLLPVQMKITEAKLAMVRVLADKVIPTLEVLYQKHWPAISQVIGDVVAFIQKHWPEISFVINLVYENTKTKIEGMIQFIKGVVDVVSGVVKVVKALWHGEWNEAWEGFKQIVSGAIQIVEGQIKATLGNIPQLIKQYGPEVAKAGLGLIESLLKGIVDKAPEVFVWFNYTLPKKITEETVKLVTQLYDAGWNAIQGFINGIINKAKELPGVIEDQVVKLIPGKVRDLLGIHSPSTVMMELGSRVSEGFGKGIAEGAQKYVLPAANGIMSIMNNLQSKVAATTGDITIWPHATSGIVNSPPTQPYNGQNNETMIGGYKDGWYAGRDPKTGNLRYPIWNGVKFYATGTPYVPRTGLAMLHKGEAVIPANMNRIMQRAINIHLHVAGSILSNKDIVKMIADELNSGGFRGYISRG